MGLPGVNGTNGTPGLSGSQRIGSSCGSPVTIAKNAAYTCNVTCPSGKMVLGGGINQANAADSLTIVTGWPSQNDVWSILVRNDDNKAGTYSLAAWAVCASVTP